jgi:hypothetical protein
MIPRALVASLVLLGAAPVVGDGALRVWTGERWLPWFVADSAPTKWDAPLPLVADAVAWRHVRPGVDVGRLRLSGAGEAWRVGVVLVRVDPAQVRWELAWGMGAGDRKIWTIDSAPGDAILALNAGMFNGSAPFGWAMLDGTERGIIGSGVLAPAFVIDTAGHSDLVPADRLQARRAQRDVRLAFQSYPELLRDDGTVPPMLRPGATELRLGHRDARLALGRQRDGHWLVVLTRFEGAGGALSFLPFGLTIPEMAALMGALGCEAAVSLDGGVSAQLAVRDSTGQWEQWPGIRKVALGLVAYPR